MCVTSLSGLSQAYRPREPRDEDAARSRDSRNVSKHQKYLLAAQRDAVAAVRGATQESNGTWELLVVPTSRNRMNSNKRERRIDNNNSCEEIFEREQFTDIA